MVSKKVQIELDLDARQAQKDLKKLAKDTSALGEELEDVETAGEAMARAITTRADEMKAEIDATARAVEAMAGHLDDVDMDPRDAVAGLKKLGLSAEDVEADAEQLAQALREAADVKVHAAEAGFDDLNQAIGDVDGSTGKAGDTMSGFIGGTVGELPLISEAMGPVGEGLGQLVEGAAAGELKMKDLALAGGAMAGVAVAVQGINGHFEKMAAIDAFNTQQVEDYVDALTDADTELDGIVDKLRQAEGVQINVFGDELDVTESIVQAGLDLEQFAELVEQGEDRWREWADAAEAAGVDGEAIRGTLLALSSEGKAFEEATHAAAVTQSFLGDTMDDTKDSADDLTDALDDEADALDDVADEASTAADEVSGLEDAFADLRGEMSDRSAYLGVQNSFDDIEKKGVEAWTATKDEAEDAERQVRDYELAQIALKDEVIRYAEEVGNIPPSKVSEILAAIDQGSIDEARRLLDELEKPRRTSLGVRVFNELTGKALASGITGAFARGTQGSPAGTALVGENGPELVELPRGSRVADAGRTRNTMRRPSGGSSTIIVNMPAGSRPEDIETLRRRYSHRNGPRS